MQSIRTIDDVEGDLERIAAKEAASRARDAAARRWREGQVEQKRQAVSAKIEAERAKAIAALQECAKAGRFVANVPSLPQLSLDLWGLNRKWLDHEGINIAEDAITKETVDGKPVVVLRHIGDFSTFIHSRHGEDWRRDNPQLMAMLAAAGGQA